MTAPQGQMKKSEGRSCWKATRSVHVLENPGQGFFGDPRLTNLPTTLVYPLRIPFIVDPLSYSASTRQEVFPCFSFPQYFTPLPVSSSIVPWTRFLRRSSLALRKRLHPYSTVSFPPLGLSFPCIVRRHEILSRHSIDVQDLISYLVGTSCLVGLELPTQAHLHTLRTQGLTSLVIHASSSQPDDSRAIHPESSDSWLLLLTRPLRLRCPCRPKTVALFRSAIAIPSKT